MPITITFASAKGGVGKSSLALSLAAYLTHNKKRRILLVDTDSQSNTSQFFLPPEIVDKLPTEQTLAAVFDDAYFAEPDKVIHATSTKGLFFVPASDHLARFNLPEPHKTGDLQYALREFIDDVKHDFDAVVIDTPPQLEQLTSWSALLASDFCITPLVMESFAIQAIARVTRVLRAAKQYNPKLGFLGYVVNLYDQRKSWHAFNEKKLREHYGDLVFETVVNNLTAFAEAQGARQSIDTYAKSKPAIEITNNLCREIVSKAHAQIVERQQRKANSQRRVA